MGLTTHVQAHLAVRIVSHVQSTPMWAIAGVHGPATLAYLFALQLLNFPPVLFFFFILTLIGYTWIMKQGYQSDRPALHIVEPVVLNCPSGPFRSEFLMSKQTTLFRCDRCFSSDMEMKNL